MRHRILLVDDHPHYLSSLRQLLETTLPDVTVITAGDGSNGMLLARRQTFNLIILDYQLPSLSGSDVIRQLRAWADQARVVLPPIVLTSSQPDVAVFARALRVAAFLPKPILSEQITHVIEPLLHHATVEPVVQQKLWPLQPRNG